MANGRKADAMARCWEMRGCDEEMQSRCMHSTTLHDRCPTKCAWGFCRLPQNELTTDPALVFAPEPDRSKAVKDSCLHCVLFLTKGPKL
jgi:hypothetical protein